MQALSPLSWKKLEPEEIGDGAKLWFALRHEKDVIMEPQEHYS